MSEQPKAAKHERETAGRDHIEHKTYTIKNNNDDMLIYIGSTIQ